MIRVFIGYDPREAAAFHVCCQSIIEHTTSPVEIIPMHAPMLGGFDGQRDGSNGFIFSRYRVPVLSNFDGWALFLDGDMIVRADLTDLWMLRDERYAVQVVQHDYQTKHPVKYVGTPLESRNLDYPRKNWSSVMLWNCGHPANRVLSPEFIEDSGASFLHRLQWLSDEQIGALPRGWNYLVGEDDAWTVPPEVRLLHYTLGVPGFVAYRGSPGSNEWLATAQRTMHLVGESPAEYLGERHA